MLGLRFWVRAFSSCGEWGPLFITVRGPLTVVASLFAEHRLQTFRLSSCGSRAQLLRGMWDLPRPGLEPVSPALAGRFSTTVPPGKPKLSVFYWLNFGRLYVFRNLPISSRLSNLLVYNCSEYFLTIFFFCISVVSVDISPLSFLILFIWVLQVLSYGSPFLIFWGISYYFP